MSTWLNRVLAAAWQGPENRRENHRDRINQPPRTQKFKQSQPSPNPTGACPRTASQKGTNQQS